MKLQAALGDRSYSVWIERGLGALPSALDEAFGPGGPDDRRPCALVVDKNVSSLHGQRYGQMLEKSGFCPRATVEVEAGEPSKNLRRYGEILETLAAAGLDRKTPVFALGGGVTGDLAGFIAATFLRGVPLVQLPTTLLAQVDSAIGGKTGVNLEAGKNLVGAFWQPKVVYSDVSTLATLPPRELAAGMAEVVKYGVIGDPTILTLLERTNIEKGAPADAEVLADLIGRSSSMKLRIVEEDERESGRRALLNFGHTVGHAIEAATAYNRFLHGEAVGLGMLAAARLSAKVVPGEGNAKLESRLAAILTKLDLPIDVDAYLTPSVLERVAVDKKRAGDGVRFVVAKKAGQAETVLLKVDEILRVLLP